MMNKSSGRPAVCVTDREEQKCLEFCDTEGVKVVEPFAFVVFGGVDGEEDFDSVARGEGFEVIKSFAGEAQSDSARAHGGEVVIDDNLAGCPFSTRGDALDNRHEFTDFSSNFHRFRIL